jgi:hypothetical protein
VAGEKIRSGPEIVKDFVDGLKADSSLDEGVVEALSGLQKEGKLTPQRLVQELEAKRKKGTING